MSYAARLKPIPESGGLQRVLCGYCGRGELPMYGTGGYFQLDGWSLCGEVWERRRMRRASRWQFYPNGGQPVAHRRSDFRQLTNPRFRCPRCRCVSCCTMPT
jgi:hypothetical protein